MTVQWICGLPLTQQTTHPNILDLILVNPECTGFIKGAGLIVCLLKGAGLAIGSNRCLHVPLQSAALDVSYMCN